MACESAPNGCVRLALMATQLGVEHQRSLYADEFRFLVQQWRQLIDVQLSSAAAVVEPVVPLLRGIVRSHRRLERTSLV